MLKDVIESYFKKSINDKEDVALLFSGGTDSLTCLFSLLNMGIKPNLYSFRLENTIHKDIEISIKVAQHFNLNHEIIVIKEDIEELVRDVKYLCKDIQLSRKTNVQCTYPFLHVIPKIKESIIVAGLCADDLYGTSKSMSIKFAKDKNGFDVARKKILENEYSSAYKPIKTLCELHNKKFIVPYRNENVITYFMNKSWGELNKPKQKQVALDSYKEYFDELKVYRRNTNLQVGSKVREWHNNLLSTELNKGFHRVDEIYKSLNKEVSE